MNLTYKDFKIGEKLICVKQSTNEYIGDSKGDDRLILGKEYIVFDLDYHFPDRVCVQLTGPYYFHCEFVPIECFKDLVSMRRLELNKILD